MHEKVEHLLAQKNQRQEDIRQNKLPLLQILFNVNFSSWIFTSNFANNFNCYI